MNLKTLGHIPAYVYLYFSVVARRQHVNGLQNSPSLGVLLLSRYLLNASSRRYKCCASYCCLTPTWVCFSSDKSQQLFEHERYILSQFHRDKHVPSERGIPHCGCFTIAGCLHLHKEPENEFVSLAYPAVPFCSHRGELWEREKKKEPLKISGCNSPLQDGFAMYWRSDHEPALFWGIFAF